MSIIKEIESRVLFFDGGLGSMLQARGLKPGALPEIWNITNKETIIEIHKEYLKAGADIINTNTFGVNSLKFPKGSKYNVETIVKAAVNNVKTAIKEVKSENKKYISLDLGPTGKLLKPLGDLDFFDAYELYKEVVTCGEKAGADLILIETINDTYEAKAAVLAAKENSNLPVFITVTLDEKGKLLTGGDIDSIVALLEGLRVDAIGFNCGLGPIEMKKFAKYILKISSTPVIITPNAGLPREENGQTIYDIDSDTFAKTMEEICDMGVSILGGCCGTTPEHINKTIKLCKNKQVKKITNKNLSVVSSYSKSVYINEDPIIIGERINPTGKKRFKQALIDKDIEYILNEAITQIDNGAHVLDVNVGLPDINEVEMMEYSIKELQSITNTPLQIDTSNIEAMEKALRVYNGKALINSVNGKEEIMDKVFPLVKKYGGVVVALCLDENGIPDTSQGRIEIANKIYKTAQKYGIDKKDIIIDALAMTVSADTKSALVTLDTLDKIKKELKGHSILGVSNISFGLPNRENINASFFTMALQNGLNAAIINPNSEEMLKSYYSYRTLANLDDKCMDYIEKYNNTKPIQTKITSSSMTLEESIIKGMKEKAGELTKDALNKEKPLEVVNKTLIPALDVVGKGFENGTMFLPQLLMSAEAAKSAFNEVKNFLIKSGSKEEKKGKIILATVKGDIHDIGKNIVKVLLDNYGYEVIDLGKDVDPELVVATAKEKNVTLVGLSALMTTTVPNMEETIKQLNKSLPECKIFVGGAVLTKDYAQKINANYYAKDAMESVNYAKGIFG